MEEKVKMMRDNEVLTFKIQLDEKIHEERMAELRSEHNQKIANLESENMTLEMKIIDQQNKIKQLEEAIDEKKLKIKDLTKQKCDLERTILQTKSQGEKHVMEEQDKRFQNEIADLKEEIQKQKEELQKYKEEMQKQKEEMQKKAEDKEDIQNMIMQFGAKMARDFKEEMRIERERNEKDRTNSELRNQARHMEVLQCTQNVAESVQNLETKMSSFTSKSSERLTVAADSCQIALQPRGISHQNIELRGPERRGVDKKPTFNPRRNNKK